MSFQIVAVGTSLGGFQALKTLLGGLPKDFPLPVVVVQHRSPEDSEAFAPLMAGHTLLPLVEIEDKEVLLAGHVYMCPSNYHVLVDETHLALSTDAPVSYARPSIDVLFESAAEAFREGTIGVLLTGMSRDGTAGLARIKECGGLAIVQDPATAEGQMMPRTAISSGVADKVLPLSEIAPFLVELCAGEKARV